MKSYVCGNRRRGGFVARFFNEYSKKRDGFTLIELLVVVAIIGLLASTVLYATQETRENAKVARAVADIKQLRNLIALYAADVGQPPTVDCIHDTCNASNDPMLNSLGVLGWNGPYLPGFHNLEHPWGGHISYSQSVDWDGDGESDVGLILNDDEPGTPVSNNQGRIPLGALLKIDEIIDDGDLSTGLAFGNGSEISCVVGEICVVFIEYKIPE